MNTELFDRFTLFHLLAGYVAKKFGISFTNTVIFSIAFEILESPLKQANPDLFPHPSPDTTTNMIGDTLAVIVGWNLG